MTTEKLYQAELMEHYKNSAHRGTIENCDFYSTDHNPSCGDRIAIYGKLNNSIIDEIKFSGSGCVLSQASASLIAEYLIGKTLIDAQNLSKDDLINMIGLELGPNRLKCVLLSLEVLKTSISKI